MNYFFYVQKADAALILLPQYFHWPEVVMLGHLVDCFINLNGIQ